MSYLKGLVLNCHSQDESSINDSIMVLDVPELGMRLSIPVSRAGLDIIQAQMLIVSSMDTDMQQKERVMRRLRQFQDRMLDRMRRRFVALITLLLHMYRMVWM
uniref:(northern house mosquito) hypothetical protein n=1 Tax=Culex pipiens TaxID=7175 RepID=A0A8D8FHM5_CULPI